MWGNPVDVEALRQEYNYLVIVVAPPKSPPNLLNNYTYRWGTETLFGTFESRGFNLEDTYLQELDHLSHLLTLLTIALCWSFRTGEWLYQYQHIALKTHGRKAKSIFSSGFDYLRRLVFNLYQIRLAKTRNNLDTRKPMISS